MGDGLKHSSRGTTFVQTCFEVDEPDKLQVVAPAYSQTASAKPEGKAQRNSACPESGLMKSKHGFDRCCRA